jgi:uncharacterized membrane protein YkoI
VKTSTKYRIHKTIAIIVVPILIIATITGVFKANQKWYWEDGYKKKKQSSHISINKELISINSITRKIDSLTNTKNKFEEISVRDENGNLYYKFASLSKEKYLIDAYTGIIVSPLNNKLASSFATQYVKDKPKIKTCELLNNYTSRKAKEAKPAYKIMFDNKVHSEIYLDYQTGEIIEDIDDNRHFGIWIMRLHEYDFFNSKKSITLIVGIIMMLLALSGIWIYKLKLNKKKLVNN